MQWPEGKDFAFTIIDDTDFATVENVEPVYNFLYENRIFTTKTVWVYPPRDHFRGGCLENQNYLDFVKKLQKRGFEIALHHVGSGAFTRDEIHSGLEEYKKLLGERPNIHINHARNPDKIYWGYKRFSPPMSTLFRAIQGKRSFGDEPNSEHFWGDIHKQNITYTRNHIFNGINTLQYNVQMPYRVQQKNQYSNYWFSSSDGHSVSEFNELTKPNVIDRLKKERGCCIVYTHLAEGFAEKGSLNQDFKKNIKYLARQNGWFVPASKILDYLSELNGAPYLNYFERLRLDLLWLKDRLIKKYRTGI